MTRGRQQQQQRHRSRRTTSNEHTNLIGTQVSVVQKHDQPTGHLTRGTVAEILTNSAFHPRGLKVRLTDGQLVELVAGNLVVRLCWIIIIIVTIMRIQEPLLELLLVWRTSWRFRLLLSNRAICCSYQHNHNNNRHHHHLPLNGHVLLAPL